jgi:LysR family transcriptional regulator for metE and metH
MRHLRLLRAVADHGGLTRAGSALHLSQSALSHQLRDLEDALGLRLFERVGRRMVLTYAGTRLLEHSRRALDIVEGAETEVRRLASGAGTVLRLSTQCYTCYNWLPRVLGPFHRQFPGVEVRIDAAATDRPIAALLAGEIDLALVFDGTGDAQVRMTRLFEDENIVVMAPGHPLAGKKVVEAADLADVPLYLYAAPLEETVLYRRILRPAGVRPRQAQHIQLTEAAIELVKAGLGVSVLARWAVEPHLKAGQLVGRRLTARGYRRAWSAATLGAQKLPDHVSAFIRLVKEGPLMLRAPRRTAERSSAPSTPVVPYRSRPASPAR